MHNILHRSGYTGFAAAENRRQQLRKRQAQRGGSRDRNDSTDSIDRSAVVARVHSHTQDGACPVDVLALRKIQKELIGDCAKQSAWKVSEEKEFRDRERKIRVEERGEISWRRET
ncbi:unnamed protein product [Ectocarpus sp. CCAP 1310/34]|nr:unnamed protein product [Ectocarpus sp. CCAP 1310/34]